MILPDVINPRLDNRTNTQLPLAAQRGCTRVKNPLAVRGRLGIVK